MLSNSIKSNNGTVIASTISLMTLKSFNPVNQLNPGSIPLTQKHPESFFVLIANGDIYFAYL
ncbi:hypothetical protein SAMN05192573_109168 [Mucilaginibacter gossypii]|uniref:Uncharacterized protein n=1 Tax=Mucilaginibacter gossypii TaxID=551996 RepID=A0A1G8C8X1_9SPHI|nr:hypothetical protein SAMN05192573_109168 [Mucilaginibacter gossypii]